MSQRNLEGTVTDRTGCRYENAVVRLSAVGVQPEVETTDDDGDFRFDLSDEQRWPAGTYSLHVFHPQLMTAEDPEPLELEAGKEPTPVTLVAVARNQVSARAGWWFMGAMFLLLAVVVVSYFHLHNPERFPELGAPPPYDEDLTRLLKTARSQAKAASVGPDSLVADSVAAAKATYESLRQGEEGLFSERKQLVVGSLFAQADKAIKAGEARRLKGILRGLVQSVSRERERFFWTYRPAQLLEVLFWALGAMLIRLIFNAGNYLRQRRFYANAIPHHLALIVTAPILAILIAFVLSLVEVNVGLGEKAITLDLGNVAISILVGGIIGLAPWRAWDFMQTLADAFFKSLMGLFAKGGDDAGS